MARHAIVHPDAITWHAHKVHAAQLCQVLRHSRLRESQAVVDMTHANLVVAEQRENAQAGPVRERLEGVLDVIDGGASHCIYLR